jgi:hypothetical protein
MYLIPITITREDKASKQAIIISLIALTLIKGACNLQYLFVYTAH